MENDIIVAGKATFKQCLLEHPLIVKSETDENKFLLGFYEGIKYFAGVQGEKLASIQAHIDKLQEIKQNLPQE